MDQHLINPTSTWPWSVVVKFTTSKVEMLVKSNLHYIEIDPDTPSPHKHQVAYL